ncbi:MAG: HAD family hydrolase [Chloroflexota bacterium]
MNKDTCKLLAVDVDGTILNSAHQLTDPVCSALQQLSAQGIHVILNSARSPASMGRFTDRIGLQEMIVALNGALVLDAHGKPCHRTPMAVSAITTILSLSRYHNVTANLFTGFDWYVEKMDDLVQNQMNTVAFAPTVGILPNAVLAHIEKILVRGDLAAMQAFHQQLTQQNLSLATSFSKPTFCEITAAGVSKATGLRYVCDTLAISADEVVAIGDNFNDVAMLEFAGYGVAMGNAPEGVQAIADEVIGHHNADGVADFVEAFFLS